MSTDSTTPNQGHPPSDQQSEDKAIPYGLSREANKDNSREHEDIPRAHKKPFPIRGLLFICRRWKWTRGPNWAEMTTVLVTSGILLATCVQAWIYWQQSLIMKAQVEQTERSVILGTGQLAVAGRNAKIAESAAATARQSLVSVQRAFVNYSKLDYSRIEDGTRNYWQLDPTIENSGATPAVAIINYIGAGQLPDEPDEATFRGNETQFYVSSLGPKGQRGVGALIRDESALFGEDFDITRRDPTPRKGRTFIWSWVAYRDIFGSAHVTEFCTEVQLPMLRKKGTQEVKWNLKDCENHSCTDKYCADYQSIVELLPKRPE